MENKIKKSLLAISIGMFFILGYQADSFIASVLFNSLASTILFIFFELKTWNKQLN